jgi:hypothetical protein
VILSNENDPTDVEKEKVSVSHFLRIPNLPNLMQ